MLCKEGIDLWNALRFGLVLSGGGAKGAYEAGCIKAMRELDVASRVYGVSGTSVGALNTILFAMGDGDRMEDMWQDIGLSTVAPVKTGDEHGLRGIIGKIGAQLNENEGLCTQEALRQLIEATIDFDTVRAHRAELFACAYDIEAHHVEYFNLKELTNEEMTSAVLASAAIPRVYDAVTVNGRKYADGGINESSYGIKNCDRTPIAPLQDKDYDILIVIHLRERETKDLDHIGKMRLLHVYPSKPIEASPGTGSMNFKKSTLQERFTLGYSDMTIAIAALLMDYLKK